MTPGQMHPKNVSHTGSSWGEYVLTVVSPSFWADELQLKAAAERLEKKLLILYIDSDNKWAQRL